VIVVRPRFRAGRKLVEAAPDAVAVGGLRELLSAKPGLPALRVSPVEVALGNTYHGYHTHAASKVVGASFVRRQRQSAEAVERRSEPRTGTTTAAGRHPSRMELGVIGLGRMGQIVVNRSLDAGHDVVAFDLSAEATATAAEAGATAADSVADLCDRLDDSDEDGKRIWLMVPAGEPVDATLADLEPHLDADDVVVDGGNSKFQESVRRAEETDAAYLDCGTSGGPASAEEGFSHDRRP